MEKHLRIPGQLELVLEDLEIKGHKALWVGRGMSGKSWEMGEYDLVWNSQRANKNININQQNQRCLRKLSSVSVPSKCKDYDT